jgi:hypothetical protein
MILISIFVAEWLMNADGFLISRSKVKKFIFLEQVTQAGPGPPCFFIFNFCIFLTTFGSLPENCYSAGY